MVVSSKPAVPLCGNYYTILEQNLQKAGPADPGTCATGARGSARVLARSQVDEGFSLQAWLHQWLKGLQTDLHLVKSRGLINTTTRLKSSG